MQVAEGYQPNQVMGFEDAFVTNEMSPRIMESISNNEQVADGEVG